MADVQLNYADSFALCLNQPHDHIDDLMQKRHNSSALAMDLHLLCIKP